MYDYNRLEGDYGAIDQNSSLLRKTTKQFGKYKELYPSIMTLVLFAVFGSPMISGYRMINDPNVKYWIGGVGLLVFPIPFFLAAGHIIQAYYAKPMFFPLLLMIVPPALLCIFTGYGLFMPISGIVVKLLSSDCITFADKWYVQNAYQEALKVWNECAEMQANATKMKAEDVKAGGLTLVECDNYKPEGSDFKKEWAYLEALEIREGCAGWCYNGEISLWAGNDPKSDACSSVVAAILNSKVGFASQRMMINGIVGLMLGGGAIFAINEMIQRSPDGGSW